MTIHAYQIHNRTVTSLCAVAILALVACGCSTDDPAAGDDAGPSRDAVSDTPVPDTGRDAADAQSPQDATDEDATDADAADADAAVDAASDADAGPGDASDTRADVADVADAVGDVSDATLDAGADTSTTSADTCATAIDVTSGGTWNDQSTTGAANDYDSDPSAPGCPSGSASGNDRVYLAAPAAATEYRVTVVPEGSFDPFIHVRADCSQQACMAGTVLNGAGTQESVTFELQAGETGYIIVDGELFSEGDYTLTVEIL